MGDISRPYLTTRRVTLIGHDHFHQPHMTDMQREIRDAKLQPVRASERWWVSFAGALGLTVFVLVMLTVWGIFG